MINRLFVYGTLAPGRANAHVLADIPGTWEPALSPASWFLKGGEPRRDIRESCWMRAVRKSKG